MLNNLFTSVRKELSYTNVKRSNTYTMWFTDFYDNFCKELKLIIVYDINIVNSIYNLL